MNKLVLLREVAVHGGITHAAAAMQTSASNVSQQLRRFERDLGVALLETVGRGVRLTAAGEQLVERAESLLELLAETETDVAELRSDPGETVRIAGFHTFAVGLLGTVVRRLEQIAPKLTLEFVQFDPEGAIEEVLARRADIAIVDEYRGYTPSPVSGLVRTVIGEEPIKVYAPGGRVNLASIPWAMEPEYSDAAKWATSVCREAGFEPRVMYTSPDPYVHRQLIEEGLAAGFLPATVASGISATALTGSNIPGPLHRTYALLTRRGSLRSPAIRACHTAIVTAFKEALPGTQPTLIEGTALPSNEISAAGASEAPPSAAAS